MQKILSGKSPTPVCMKAFEKLKFHFLFSYIRPSCYLRLEVLARTSVKVVETASEVIVSVLSASLGHRPGKQTPWCCFSGGDLIWEINVMDQRG